MDTSVISKAIESSIAGDSSTPDYGAVDRQKYLNMKRDELRRALVTPVEVTVRTSEWIRRYGEFQLDEYEMIAVARDGDHWLLYDPESTEFCAADGPSNGDITLIGFKSTDALAEWLG